MVVETKVIPDGDFYPISGQFGRLTLATSLLIFRALASKI
jgi:hypothetical protein